MATRSLSALLCALLLLTGTACHNPDAYQPVSPTNDDGLDPDEVLKLTPQPASIPADGVSRTVITAKIDPRSTVRTIAFTTSLGALIGNGKTIVAGAGALSVDADVSGTATVELRSTAEVATAQVTGTITLAAASGTTPARTIVRSLDVNFTSVSLDDFLTLETDAATLSADGFSTATITARISVRGDRRQTVTFGASRGTLVQLTTGATNSNVTADANGVARILLRSDTTVGTARVTATVLGYQRDMLVQFVPVDPNSILTLTADAAQAPADGATLTRLVARVSPSLPAANREVTFRATDGTFATNTTDATGREARVTADAGNVAIIDLKSPTNTGTVGITATVSNVTQRALIVYTPAAPDTIFLQAPASVAAAGATSITVTVFLSRDRGQVSSNTIVTFTARDSSGATIGTFFNVTLAQPDTSDGSTYKRLKATADFDPVDSAATGTAIITATAGGRLGTIQVRIN
jgi:adhesin/invasin